MGRNDSSNWNLEELTDAEVFLAILHLDPDDQARDDCGDRSMLIASILILVLGCIGLFCFDVAISSSALSLSLPRS
jgi:hypothetical protein